MGFFDWLTGKKNVPAANIRPAAPAANMMVAAPPNTQFGGRKRTRKNKKGRKARKTTRKGRKGSC